MGGVPDPHSQLSPIAGSPPNTSHNRSSCSNRVRRPAGHTCARWHLAQSLAQPPRPIAHFVHLLCAKHPSQSLCSTPSTCGNHTARLFEVPG